MAPPCHDEHEISTRREEPTTSAEKTLWAFRLRQIGANSDQKMHCGLAGNKQQRLGTRLRCD
jgi:hypothetical protein